MCRMHPERLSRQCRNHPAMKWPLLFSVLISCSTVADPVWHCSRNTEVEKTAVPHVRENQFSIASFGTSTEIIGVSISDLIDVYSGVTVRVGGLPLSACFMPNNEKLTSTALASLGLQASTIQALARKSTIIHSHLYLVTNDVQMLSCISQHFPAVGYLDEPHDTVSVQPCF